MAELPLNQVAISVSDVQHSQRWYRDVFGYLEAGGTNLFVPLFGSADVQGVPGATSECWWLMDAQDFFQLELFEFRRPTPRPLPEGWRPCDIGYTTVGIHVDDFDATLARLARRQVPLLTEPLGGPGARRVCVRDPDGVLLEVMEDDPRSARQRPRPYAAPVATRFVTLSVPDLEQARRTWVEVLGLPEERDVVLHTAEHERLWGLAGASRESFLVRAGDLFVEVVRYLDPVGEPWPEGYRISDHGLLNVALGLRSADEHAALVRRCAAAGVTPNSTRPTLLKRLWYAVYVNDPLGFSIELLYHARAGRKRLVNPFDLLELGFVQTPAPLTRASASGYAAAPPRRVWDVLADHRNRGDWPGLAGAEVVTAEEPHRLEYRLPAAGGRWRRHAFVTLAPTQGGGTSVTWEEQFRTALPGRRRPATRALRSLVGLLVEAAEQPEPVH